MMEKTRIRGRGRCVRTWLAVCLAVAACASTAGAQTFKSDEPKMSDAEGNALNQTVMQLKESGLAGGEARSQFESYFKDYLFPVMTRTTAEGLTRIGNHRERLLRLFQAPIHDQSFQALTALTLAEMKRIATDNYHPATRYNAMLIIGALDQQPGSPTGGAAQAPQPLAEATDFLIQMLEADRSQAPDLVKLGAIVGLERHARSGLPDDKRKAVTDQLVELVVAERPNYRTAEFHAWLQWRAVDVLTQLGELGENNRVHNAIVTFMANDNAPLTERYYAAKSLEKLKPKYTPQAGIDAQATVAALGNVLADVMASEKEEAFKFNQDRLMGGGLAYQLIGLGDEKPPGYAAGRFLQRVDYVLAGFTAIEAVLPDELKQEVQAALTLLQGVRAVALDRRAVPEALPIKIEQTADQLVDAAEGLGQVAAAADEQGLEDLQDLQ